jgi:hypothetical protein
MLKTNSVYQNQEPKTILELLKDYSSDIENMWDRISKEVHSGKPVGKERSEEIVYKRDKIIRESIPYIEVSKIIEIGPAKFMDISKLVTKSWEETVKNYGKKGMSQLELLEDKLS